MDDELEQLSTEELQSRLTQLDPPPVPDHLKPDADLEKLSDDQLNQRLQVVQRQKYAPQIDAQHRLLEREQGDESALHRAARSVVNVIHAPFTSGMYGKALNRLHNDEPTPDDFHTIAYVERQQAKDASLPAWQQTGNALLSLPGHAVGFAAGGAATEAVGLGAAAAGTGIAAKIGLAAVRLPVQTALTPNLYVDRYLQNNIEAGRDPLDPAGLPNAYSVGAAQMAVLAATGGLAGKALPGPGVAKAAGRVAIQGAQGPFAQQAADTVTQALGLTTGYGNLVDLVNGKEGALDHVVTDALTFAAFSGQHEIMHGLQADLNQLHKQGKTANEAAEQLQRDLQGGLQDGREAARSALTQANDAAAAGGQGQTGARGQQGLQTPADGQTASGQASGAAGAGAADVSGVSAGPGQPNGVRLAGGDVTLPADHPLLKLVPTLAETEKPPAAVTFTAPEEVNGDKVISPTVAEPANLDAMKEFLQAVGMKTGNMKPDQVAAEAKARGFDRMVPADQATTPDEPAKPRSITLSEGSEPSGGIIRHLIADETGNDIGSLGVKKVGDSLHIVTGVAAEEGTLTRKIRNDVISQLAERYPDAKTVEWKKSATGRVTTIDLERPAKFDASTPEGLSAGITALLDEHAPDPRDRAVVERRLGLKTGTTESMGAIAKDLGISRARVQQIEKDTFEKIGAKISVADAQELIARRDAEVRSGTLSPATEEGVPVGKAAAAAYNKSANAEQAFWDKLTSRSIDFTDKELANVHKQARKLGIETERVDAIVEALKASRSGAASAEAPRSAAVADAASGRGPEREPGIEPDEQRPKLEFAERMRRGQSTAKDMAAEARSAGIPEEHIADVHDVAQELMAAHAPQEVEFQSMLKSARKQMRTEGISDIALRKGEDPPGIKGFEDFAEHFTQGEDRHWFAGDARERAESLLNALKGKTAGGDIRSPMDWKTAYRQAIDEVHRNLPPESTSGGGQAAHPEEAPFNRPGGERPAGAGGRQGVVRAAAERLWADDQGAIDPIRYMTLGFVRQEQAHAMAKETAAQFNELSGHQFPRTKGHSPELSLLMSKNVMAATHAEAAAPYYATKVLGEGKSAETDLFSETWNELRIRNGRQFYQNQATQIQFELAQANLKLAHTSPAMSPHDYVAAEKEVKQLTRDLKEAHDILAKIKGDIGKPGKLLQTVQDFQNHLNDPEFIRQSQVYQKEVAPQLDALYRKGIGLGPNDPLPPSTQIPGMTWNMSADFADPALAGGVGNYGNLKLVKSRFQNQAKFNAENYASNLHDVLANAFAGQAQTAARAEMTMTGIKEGMFKLAHPGQEVKFGDEPAKILQFNNPSEPLRSRLIAAMDPADQKALGNSTGQLNLAVHPDVAGEYKRSTKVDWKLGAMPGADALNKINMSGFKDFASHIGNYVGALLKPRVLRNMYSSISGEISQRPEFQKTILDLLEVSAGKPDRGAESGNIKFLGKLDPTLQTGKAVDRLDRVMRHALSQAYDQGVKAGAIHDTPTGKRDFVNQAMSNRDRQSAHWFVRAAVDTKLGGFAKSGTGFNFSGIRTGVFLSPGAEATNVYQAAKMRAEIAAKILVGAFVVPAVWNVSMTGRVDGDDQVPLGYFYAGKRADGTVISIPNPVAWTTQRGLRATGLDAYVQGFREGQPWGQMNKKAIEHVISAHAHPGMGPAYQFGHTALTGRNGIDQQIAPRVGPTENPYPGNFLAALQNVNPDVASFAGWNKPPSQRRKLTTAERISSLAGKFGPQFRKKHQ